MTKKCEAFVWPSQAMAVKGFRDFIKDISGLERELLVPEINRGELKIITEDRIIWFMSTNPGEFRGRRFDKITVSESVSEEAYKDLLSDLFFVTGMIGRENE